MSDEGSTLSGWSDSRIEGKRLKALYRLWEERCNGGSMPDWKSFDILEMGEWIGYLSLLDVIQEPLDLVYRVFSTSISDSLRRELTGRRLSESEHLVPTTVRDCYFEAIHSRRPQLQHLEDVSNDGHTVVMERLVLPLSQDGRQVNMILVGY